MSGSSEIKVCLRIRPTTEGERVCIHPISDNIVAARKDSVNRSYHFDKVYDGNSEQSEIYDECCASLVKEFVNGKNVTIFACGQTSSGKTYTIGSHFHGGLEEQRRGIIPRAAQDIIVAVESQRKATPGIHYQVHCQYVEIYQEQFRDLLNPETDPKAITIREDKFGSLSLAGVQTVLIESVEDILRCLEKGTTERKTGDNNVHMHSSRSHSIFTILLTQNVEIEEQYKDMIEEKLTRFKSCKLHLVDLAGSERLKRTGAEGIRLKESVKINSGLLALSNVIGALSAATERKEGEGHVPYRDSKLTRILQDSLGGNSLTMMMACVSPLEIDFDETLNTLRYAERTKKIQNKAKEMDVNGSALLVFKLQSRIRELEAQMKVKEKEYEVHSSEVSRKKVPQSTEADELKVDVSNYCAEEVNAQLLEELK
ncbi:Kinesin-like protein kif27, partial [Phlyctochytrium bullatum]